MTTLEEKLAAGEQWKIKGNEQFKAGKYKSAITKYSTVLAYTQGLPGRTKGLSGMASMVANSGSDKLSSEQEAFVSTLEVTVYQNIATCHIKLSQWNEARDYCDKAIAVDPNAWKAYLRKAEVYLKLNDTEKTVAALDSATTALRDSQLEARSAEDHDVAVKAIAKVHVQLKDYQKSYDLKQRKKFQGMFGTDVNKWDDGRDDDHV